MALSTREELAVPGHTVRLGKPAGSILVRTRGAMKTLPMNPAGHVDSISALNRC